MQPDDIRRWLVTHVAEIVGVEAAEIDSRATFESFGLASRDVISLSGDLESWLQRRLSPTLLYQYPNIEALTNYLARDLPGNPGAAPKGPDTSPTTTPQTETRAAELAELSDEEAEALLLEKLARLD